MKFENRHIGITKESEKQMLTSLNCNSLDELCKQTIPNDINYELPPISALSEQAFEKKITEIAKKNQINRSFIGQGFHPNYCPSIIRRNILENPNWYTSYTPYQSEISQGRMEALLNFQTLITELSGLPIANASLLDEGNACSEAIFMAYQFHRKKRKKILISSDCFDSSIAVIQSRFKYLDIELVIKELDSVTLDESYAAVIAQFPTKNGELVDYSPVFDICNEKNIIPIIATDPLALTLYKSPKEMNAAIAIGSAQRFGIPLGFGGPSAAFIACSDELKRLLPGRIIGISKDRHDKQAYRMALQTREQHIRREKATSNICTAQALLAIINSFYAVYHGPDGLKAIALTIQEKTNTLAQNLISNGWKINNNNYFDTISIETKDVETLTKQALEKNIEWYTTKNSIQISINECTTDSDINEILTIFNINEVTNSNSKINEELTRKTQFLTQIVFSKYHSETKLLRYIKSLEKKDLSLSDAMIPLGSCTMKLNATTELLPLSYTEFSQIHPLSKKEFTEGYLEIINELEDTLATITGFSKTSIQPNSGAQGEFAGLMCIRSYFDSINQGHRNIALIPTSAHGTNPASATLAGLTIVPIKCTEKGEICIEDLNAKCDQYKENLAVIMITYPSTFGVFENNVKDVCKLVHKNGGQVYMDGANMNAQVGLTSPMSIGADVCHLNLHKTFCIPHGGGGPGVGPICVAEHLSPYLPSKNYTNLDKTDYVIASSAYGSASILLISYAYIYLMGSNGLKKATEVAILNANYISNKIDPYFKVLYKNENGRVAHELIIDCNPFKKDMGITVEDIAKRLIDYGFHAPTMSWPVANTLMIEPTESEGLDEINRFCEALIGIKKEIDEIGNKNIAVDKSPLKNAPHSLNDLDSEWLFNYSIDEAFFPNNLDKTTKFWPSVSRVDNVFGDRNLICSCQTFDTNVNVEIYEYQNTGN